MLYSQVSASRTENNARLIKMEHTEEGNVQKKQKGHVLVCGSFETNIEMFGPVLVFII